MRSGKALAADSAEIAIHLRPLPRYLLGQWPGAEPNVLRLGLTEPYVRLATTLNGPERTVENQELEARSAPPRRTPYANLILDMLNSDPMLFSHPRRRSRRGMAHHRPRDQSLDSRKRPHAGMPRRPGTTRPAVLTSTAAFRRSGHPAGAAEALGISRHLVYDLLRDGATTVTQGGKPRRTPGSARQFSIRVVAIATATASIRTSRIRASGSNGPPFTMPMAEK